MRLITRFAMLLFLVFALHALSGCAQHAILKNSEGTVIYSIKTSDDSLFKLAEGGLTLEFDTRGQTPFLMQLLGVGVTNTSFQLKNKGGDD